MRALLDTNVVLDAIAAREPFCADAQRLVRLAAKDRFEGCVTAKAITDIYYICRKSLSDAQAREAIQNLLDVFTVLDVRGADCEAALALPVKDFEDAVVMACAHREKLDCIVTRDALFLTEASEARILSPSTFLQIFKKED